MALEMDPERRRRIAELAAWHEEWRRRYRLDDAAFAPDGADADIRRSPTPEQEREFVHRAREIFGQDPETGHYRD